MAEKRKVVLTKLAVEHIDGLYNAYLDEGLTYEAEALMDDFLDVVFDEIPRSPELFPVCDGIKSGSHDYRIGRIQHDYCVIFQIFKDKVLILLILHERDLPF
ncbi:MAG: type II toxin-antitoxin system RelE/ParE family toxin [Bacteroidota bacterium]